MLAVLLGAQDNEATGATIGRWIDDNFVGAVSIAAVAAVALVVTFALLARGYGRQRRKNRRMRRYHEVTVQRHLEALNAKLDELRGDVSQLSELEDHVVAQLRLMREALGLAPGDAAGVGADAASLPKRPLFTGSGSAVSPSAQPATASALAASSVTPSASPRLRRSSLVGSRGASSAGERLFSPEANQDQSAGPGPSPALLVETGEPLAYSTRQR